MRCAIYAMTFNDGIRFQPFYPDVLGAITGGPRIYMDYLQCAVGIFPQQAYINQPMEVVVILQSMVDQPMTTKVAVRLPTEDKKGNPVVIETDKQQVSLGLQPGEVGVLRMPIVAHPPTQPGKGFPVRVAIRYRTARPGNPVRPPGGGAPPSVLSVSPFKLQVLREVQFNAHTWNESAEIITAYFDIAPKRIPLSKQSLRPRYETLWAQEQMPQEIELARANIGPAQEIAVGAHPSAYVYFLDAVVERFANRGMPLHPGEAKAIAKMLAYTVDEAPRLEMDLDTKYENTRWFQTLCQVLASDEDLKRMERGDLLVKYVFDAVLFDAILIAFKVIEHRVQEDLGDRTERANYANRVVAWIVGLGQPDLNYVYLPLVIGGLAISRLVKHGVKENPWEIIDELREASQGRIRLISGETIVVFNMLNELLMASEKALNSQRISR
jgi:hypothetical protein